jgi:hypothetical protein
MITSASFKSIMTGELNTTTITPESVDDYQIKTISSFALRISFLKKEIEKTLIFNHECNNEELSFLLKRL